MSKRTSQPTPAHQALPSGTEELPLLPKGWCWSKISEACSRVQDGTHFSPKEQSSTGDFKYITAKNIKHWGLDLTELTYVPERVHREISRRCKPEKGDVLYIKDGVTTGIATVNTLDEEFSLLSSVALLKPKSELLEPYFLKYYLNSPEGFRRMTGKMTGTAIKRLILQKIKEAPVPLAPLPEQRRIVAEIEKQFTRLDKGVAALRRVQANLKRYRAAVLKAACGGKLVPTEAELARKEARAYETADLLLQRILAKRRKTWIGRGKYKGAASTDKTNLPLLPKGWIWAKVEQLGDVQLGRQRSPKNVSKNYPTKYIRAANITEYGIDVTDVLSMEFSPAERERFALRNGDIVLSEASGSPSQVGKPAIWRNELPLCCFQNTVLRLQPEIIGAKYVLVAFQHFYANSIFAKVAGGVGINHLGAEKFAAIPFPLPPLAEQTRIVAEVERRLSVLEELAAVVSANLQRAVRLRQSILQNAFTGDLV